MTRWIRRLRRPYRSDRRAGRVGSHRIDGVDDLDHVVDVPCRRRQFGDEVLLEPPRHCHHAVLHGLVGEVALSSTDRRYLDFDDAFLRHFADQRSDEPRPLDDALERGWRTLLTLPRGQLSMLPARLLDAHGAKDSPDTEASR
jgi:hypothetical protein